MPTMEITYMNDDFEIQTMDWDEATDALNRAYAVLNLLTSYYQAETEAAAARTAFYIDDEAADAVEEAETTMLELHETALGVIKAKKHVRKASTHMSALRQANSVCKAAYQLILDKYIEEGGA